MNDAHPAPSHNPAWPWTWLALCLLALALMYAGTGIHRIGPDPDALDFDTGAALATVRQLIPENRPHPTGSAENRAVADRVEAGFRAAGLTVERQATDLCTAMSPGCSRVENIIATLPGSGGDNGERNVLLLLSHYDSVPASPGAGDDISGTAVLLRAAHELAAEGPWRNDIVFLVTDAEETGLRGAMAFVEQHPLAERVGLVINLEARGAAGSSALFETSTGNHALISAYADAVERPVSSSLMVEVYRRMPNGTDLTIFIDDGVPALNFAYTGAGSLYHTERDDSDRLSPGSLAHHGEQMLALARAWANADLAEARADGDATYTDLFGRWVVAWPQGWNLPLAILAVLLTAVLWLRSEGGVLAKLGALSLPLLLLVAHPLLGAVLTFPLAKWPGAHLLDHPQPMAGDWSIFIGSVLLALLAGTLAARRLSPRALLYGAWFVYALLALLLALTLPGGSYIGLLPLAAFLLPLAIESLLRRGRYPLASALLGLAAATYMAIYHYAVLEALGSFNASAMRMAALALFAIVAMPLLAARPKTGLKLRGPVLATLALLLVVTTVATTRPVATPDRPRWANLVYDLDVDANGVATNPQWRLNTYGVTAHAAASLMGFTAPPAAVDLPGTPRRPMYTKPAPSLALDAPALDIRSQRQDGDTRVIEATLRGARDGYLLALVFDTPADLLGLAASGVMMTGPDGRGIATFNGFGNDGIDVTLTLPADRDVSATLVEFSALPDTPEAREMLEARPADTSPVQRGDHAEVRRRLVL
ncbi:M20/M25/M40 family metallo-hydrolase [Marinihelvus fidelis]|uniref:M20/M25/M40 family metallo-hydrolase n=1 Tax=Marinihelvus fidelis TaxID=2613842 RepID=A0A5N0T4G5_9GAMM|nr:M20/M25/M40 family metallo-hydrolase [Marinihelvus fidelis]KAA9129698.1 M20/M25/M40 family metallo-hydrolase [Marinihelvus fidelis]